MLTTTLTKSLTKQADRAYLAERTETDAGMRRAIGGRRERLTRALTYLWQRAGR